MDPNQSLGISSGVVGVGDSASNKKGSHFISRVKSGTGFGFQALVLALPRAQDPRLVCRQLTGPLTDLGLGKMGDYSNILTLLAVGARCVLHSTPLPRVGRVVIYKC